MKIFRLFLILSVVITISYFSWSYYTSKSLQEKHERATLVFEECFNATKISYLGENSMHINKRFKQLKSIINFESEDEKEIRSDIEGRILKNSARVFEHKH